METSEDEAEPRKRVFPGGAWEQVGYIVLAVCRIRTRPCEGRRPGSIPGEDTELFACDAGARRHGGCLQSSLEWVRLPPASLESKRFCRRPAARWVSIFESARRVPNMDSDDGGKWRG